VTSAFFGQGAVRLLKTLTANNTKAFFDARRADYRGERIGVVSGAIWSDVISIFIVIATAAAIGGTGPLQSARQAAEALTPVVGPAAPQLFAFGLLGDAERGVHPRPHVLHADLIGQLEHSGITETGPQVGDLFVGDGVRVGGHRVGVGEGGTLVVGECR